ncbi:MAG: hypothetical protein K6C06_08615, partial [Lachnospiraceae bacterium]|nr:hypothetical protein [Lachnospiraceae bacterium]
PKFRSDKLPDFPEVSFCQLLNDRLRQAEAEIIYAPKHSAGDAENTSTASAAQHLSEHEVRVCAEQQIISVEVFSRRQSVSGHI